MCSRSCFKADPLLKSHGLCAEMSAVRTTVFNEPNERRVLYNLAIFRGAGGGVDGGKFPEQQTRSTWRGFSPFCCFQILPGNWCRRKEKPAVDAQGKDRRHLPPPAQGKPRHGSRATPPKTLSPEQRGRGFRGSCEIKAQLRFVLGRDARFRQVPPWLCGGKPLGNGRVWFRWVGLGLSLLQMGHLQKGKLPRAARAPSPEGMPKPT